MANRPRWQIKAQPYSILAEQLFSSLPIAHASAMLTPMNRSHAIILFASTLLAARAIAQPIAISPSSPNSRSLDDAEAKKEKVNMGPLINSEYSELFPIVTPDETVLFFTRKGSPENTGYATNQNDEDIWYSVRTEGGGWSHARKLVGPLNTATFDGVRAINVTATRLYLQNIYRTDGTRGKGFSVSTRDADGSWMFPDPLIVDDYYNDTTIAMMAVSQKEDAIIFSVKRKDGLGKHDLYVSRRKGPNEYGAPQLIRSVSNEGDEISPFIAYDDRTMYFSTDGRGGYGLHDLFVTRRLDDTWLNWSEPINLGPKINTPSFDAYLMVSAAGDTAYFSSVHDSREHGFGRSDIWKIALPQELRAGTFIPSGVSPIAVRKQEDYRGQLFRLDSIFFDVDKSELRTTSRASLDRLVSFMEQFPKIKIEVQGHTDSDASDEHNLRLSQDRARAVQAYLIKSGIDPSRVMATGYGEAMPIAPNTSEQGKQLNRRVMIQILGVD
jgi:outer membrane protein OmpA-like peptidoglycan-associated protein